MSTTDRRALHAYLDGDAHETWHQFCSDEGVSVAALLQALGEDLDAVVRTSPMGPAVIARARQIAAERRRTAGRRRKRT